jgi:serine/threonine protein kinase/Flp pilus assembly protein TadD
MSGSVSTAANSLEQLIEEFAVKIEAGEAPAVEEFAATHPEHAEQLRRVLPTMLVLAELGRSAASGQAGTSAASDGGPSGMLGDFRIVREVGRGGMGVVYEAAQVSLRRRVALKVLPFAATMDPRQLQRFHNEARAAACLHHTNIVPVYGVGCERGIHFYAMQFIDGHSLAALLEQQREGGSASSDQPPTAYAEPPSPADVAAKTIAPAPASTTRAPRDAASFRRIAEWGIQTAEALDCAHQLGIVHRDIKPANLMIDGTGRLWVTDFGLAQVQSDTRLTLTGDLVGTLRYMSPEQALAKRVVIDHRTDIYSLGATLYELLTLQPPVTGEDRQELLHQIAFEEPVAPRRLVKGIPAELETIVLKAMEKKSSERYATAQEIANDLRRWLEDKPIQARRPTLAKRLTKWTRRHKAVVSISSGVVAAALMVLLLGLLWHAEREHKLRQDAVMQRNEARRAVDKMYTQVAERLLEDEPQQTKLQREFLEEALRFYQQLARDVDDDPASQFDVAVAYRRMGTLHDKLGKWKEAEQDYGRAIAMLEQFVEQIPARAEYRRELAEGYRDLAAMLVEIGRFDDSEALTRKAMRIIEQLVAEFPDEPDYQRSLAATYGNLGTMLSGLKGSRVRIGEAEKACLQSLRLWEQLARAFPNSPNDRHGMGNNLSLMALMRMNQGDQKGARPLIQRAIEEQEAARKLRPRHPSYRESLRNHLAILADLLARSGEAEEALKVARRAVDVQQKLAADWPDVHVFQRNLADAYHDLAKLLIDRNPQEAESVVLQAVAIQEQLVRDNPEVASYRPLLLHMLYTLGKALENQGKFADSAAAVQKAIDLKPDQPEFHVTLGNLLVAQGQLDEAIAAYREAIRLRKDYANALTYVARAKELMQVRDRLPAVLQGKDQPKDASEHLAFADFCQKPFRQQYAAATRFYAAAFAAQPKLADDLDAQPRYNAACAAALAGCGQGKDADQSDAKERTRLRRQALEWLRADLAVYRQLLEKEPDKAPLVRGQMQHWQQDKDFTGVRGTAALDKLPEAERPDWQKLWADVAEMLARTENKAPAKQKSATK